MPDNTQSNDQSSGVASRSLRKIGNYLGLREEIDKKHRVTKLIRSNLSVVDLIPVDYAIRFEYITKNFDGGAGPNEYAIAYDFDTPAMNYASRCHKYDLEEANGVQLWLTDDTQAYEEFSNSFENNIVETKLNEWGQIGQQLQALIRTFPANSGLNQYIGKLGSVVRSGTAGMLNAVGLDGDIVGQTIGNIAGSAASMILQGKQISLPKIWRQSDYNPSITFNVKLISPYGDPESIKNFIIAPLIYILLLAAPESTDGLTYGLYQPVKIKSYGITNINLGAITSISLRRGGRESAYNVFKQPLQIDVGLTCIPLSGGFAYMAENGPSDTASMTMATMPYEENANGSPAFTTIGNVIQSLRPAPLEVTEQSSSNNTTASYSYESSPDNWSFAGKQAQQNNLKGALEDTIKTPPPAAENK